MLVERIRKFFMEFKLPRLQEGNKSWYASELLKDARDLYWKRTGEPVTNPVDMLGSVRMFMGKAIEDGINNHVLANLHWYGIHPYIGEEQIRIGFTQNGVTVTGKLDGLIVERRGDEFSSRPWVLEIKTKYGAGADFFQRDLNPGPEYLAQMGSYLKRASEAGITDRGMFLFVLVSNDNFGEMWEIHCEYKDGIVKTTRAISLLTGDERAIEHSLDLNATLDRLKQIQDAAEKKELPAIDKVYKYPLTDEFLSSISDYKLRDLVDGKKVLGDWQVSYSAYKQKHLELQGGAGYTQEEMQKIFDEYQRRFPKGKKTLKKVG
jgi:hypothetical protein